MSKKYRHIKVVVITDTFSHGAWTYLFLRDHPKGWLVVLGMIFPDMALLGLGASLLLTGKFDVFKPWLQQLYSVPLMPAIDTAFHSLMIWTILFLLSFINLLEIIRWFIYGVFFHIGIDVLTHKKFIPQYLWPLSHSVISGLVDYRTLLFMAVDILLLISFAVWSFRGVRNRK